MTTHDANIRQQVDGLIARARPDQIARLLADIEKAESVPSPTHVSTKTPQ